MCLLSRVFAYVEATRLRGLRPQGADRAPRARFQRPSSNVQLQAASEGARWASPPAPPKLSASFMKENALLERALRAPTRPLGGCLWLRRRCIAIGGAHC